MTKTGFKVYNPGTSKQIYPQNRNPSLEKKSDLDEVKNIPSKRAKKGARLSFMLQAVAGLAVFCAVAIGIAVPIALTFTASTTTTISTAVTTATTATTTTATTATTTSVTTTTTTTTTTRTTTTSTSTTSTTSTTTSTSTTSKTTTSTSTTSTTTTSTSTTSTTSKTTTSTTSTTSTTTTSTTSTTTITAALTAFGPQVNFNLASLTSAWSLCYSATYSAPLFPNISSILSTCYKDKLLLGCRPVGNTLLTLAAMGNRADVLFNCSASSTTTHIANGVGWYFSMNTPSWNAWGFVSGSDFSSRGNCDGDMVTNANLRLCWHMVGSFGGWRCGTTGSLDSSTSWEKVIYHAM